jgi:cobalamin synthase
MSKMKAIKTFRDLLVFLTVIPLGSAIGLGNVEKRRVVALVFLAGVLML